MSSPPALRLHLAALAALLWLIAFALSAWAAFAKLAVLWVLLPLALAFVAYVLLLACKPWNALSSLYLFAGVASLNLLAAALLIPVPPALSDDVYRYLWDARLLFRDLNPYAHAPDAPALMPLRDSLWALINHKHVPTIYPPLAQLFFAVAELLGHASWSVKLLAWLGHLATLALLFVIGRNWPTMHRRRVCLVYGLNPLALSETALNGHFDAWIGFFVLLCAWCMHRRRFWSAALAALGASGLKLIGVLLVVVWPRRYWRQGLALIGLSLLFALLPLSSGDAAWTHSGVGHYAREWQGNASIFALVYALFEALSTASPTTLSLLARATVGCLWIGVALVLRRQPRMHVLTKLRFLLLALLLCSPQVHPWYLLWLLAIEACTGCWAVVCWSGLVLFTYLPLDHWQETQVWIESTAYTIAQYAVVFAVLIYEMCFRKLRLFEYKIK